MQTAKTEFTEQDENHWLLVADFIQAAWRIKFSSIHPDNLLKSCTDLYVTNCITLTNLKSFKLNFKPVDFSKCFYQ